MSIHEELAAQAMRDLESLYGQYEKENLFALSNLIIRNGVCNGNPAVMAEFKSKIAHFFRHCSDSDSLQALADAFVNNLCYPSEEIREALKLRLDTDDKYLFMSMLMPLIFFERDMDEVVSNLYDQGFISQERIGLARKLIKKIRSAGGNRERA